MKAHRSVLLTALALFVGSQVVSGQTGGAPRAAGAASFRTVVVQVDNRSPAASDAGQGTAEQPFRTIQHAIEEAESNNARGIATAIVVRRGVYRESLAFSQGSQTDAPITLQGPAKHDAIISATEVWPNWSKAGNKYTHLWPYQWGPAPIPNGWESAGITPIVQRRETLFVNGKLIRQVLSLAALKASTKAGVFFVNEAEQRVYLKPPPGVNMAKSIVEVGVRPHILFADSQRNLTIRDLRFSGAPTGFAAAGAIVNSQNVLLDRVSFGWNNWTGLTIYRSNNVTVRSSVFNHNGSMGIQGLQSNNLTLQNDQNSYNNWRGAWGGMNLWENGMKLSGVHGAHFTNYVAVGNQAPGLWLDTDNRNVTIESSTMKHNTWGALFEANQGPITMRNSTVCGNSAYGIVDQRSNHVSLLGNRSYGNKSTQLLFAGDPLVRTITDYQSGTTVDVRSTDWVLRGNTFAGSADELLVGAFLPSSAWSLMTATMNAHNNKWIQTRQARPFRIPGSPQLGSLGNWIAASGETGATFSSSPSGLKCK